MIKILKTYGVPPRLLKAIEATYTGNHRQSCHPRRRQWRVRRSRWSPSARRWRWLAGVLQRKGGRWHAGAFLVHHCPRLRALRQALKDHEDLGFTITPRKSRRIGSSHPVWHRLCGWHSPTIWPDQRGPGAAEQSGVGVWDAKKTEYMVFNIGNH